MQGPGAGLRHIPDIVPLPERMCLIILPISIFGAIGTPGQAFISELSRRVVGSVPPSLLPHASWATPRVGPMIRMALTHAVRRGLAASIHTHWRRENLVAGGEGDEAMPPAPSAGGPPPGFMPIYLGRWHLWPRRHSWRPLWRGRLNACGMMAASGRGYVLGASYLNLYSRSRSRCSCVVVLYMSNAWCSPTLVLLYLSVPAPVKVSACAQAKRVAVFVAHGDARCWGA